MGSGALGQQRPNFDGYIYIHHAARPYSARLASALFTSCRLATFAWVHFAVCDAWQRSKMQNLRRLGENSGPILTRLRTKVHEIFRRYSTNVTVFWASSFFGERWPRIFCGSLLARLVHRLAKFGWVLFAYLRLQSLAMKWNAQFTEGGKKLRSNLKPFVDQSSYNFETI